MARTSRTRNRVLSVSGSGTADINGGPPTSVGPYTNSREICIDSYGSPWVDSSFSVGKGRFARATLNGFRFGSGVTRNYHNYPLDPGGAEQWTITPWTIHNSIAGAKYSTNTLAAKALANANPNTPVIDLPVSILELRELPDLLRDAGSIALNTRRKARAKASAKANLAAQFGVAPIVLDLLTLLNFAEKVAQREAYLARLNSAEPIRIKRGLGKQIWDATFDLSTQPPGITITRMNYRTTSTYWFTMRAHLSTLISQRDIQTLAFKAALGTQPIVSASSVWELLPWSWLVDWCSDLGDILAAYRTGLPFVWSNLNIMCSTEYQMAASFPSKISTMSVEPSNPHGTAVHKTRTPVAAVWPYPTWRIPYLSARQWSILTSLAILRL